MVPRELFLLGVLEKGRIKAEGPPLHWRTGASRERCVGFECTVPGSGAPCGVQLSCTTCYAKLKKPLPLSLIFSLGRVGDGEKSWGSVFYCSRDWDSRTT